LATLKGIIIWILGFFSLLAGANVVNATIMWFNLGPTATFDSSLISGLKIPVYAYFLVSFLTTLAFLGGTTHQAVSELSNTEKINAINEKTDRLEKGQNAQQKLLENAQAKIFLVDEAVERSRKEFSKGLSDQGEAIIQSMENDNQAQQKTLKGIQGRVFLLEESTKAINKSLGEQAENIEKDHANLLEKLGRPLADIESSLMKTEQRGSKTEATISKQEAEIEEINLRIGRLENALARGTPLLTSQSKLETVKGIGEGKAAELREMGIANVGDLIMADPKVAALKMGSSEKTFEKLQGRAQLSLIPGMKEKALFLLEELDIVDRKSLAEQDTIELSKKINAIFNVNVANGKVSEGDKPTIEEIDSWVKYVRA
jgi:hypothetical protein